MIVSDFAPQAPPPPLPYTLSPLTPTERLTVKLSGLDPDEHVVAECMVVQPPQLARGPNGAPAVLRVVGPDGQAQTVMVFMLAVALPLEPPVLAMGVLGPNGQPAEATQMEGPRGAISRVLLPKASLNAYARGVINAQEEPAGGALPTPS